MKSKRTMKESKPETIVQIIRPERGAVSLNAKGWPGVHVFRSGDIPSLEGKLSSGLGMRIFFSPDTLLGRDIHEMENPLRLM